MTVRVWKKKISHLLIFIFMEPVLYGFKKKKKKQVPKPFVLANCVARNNTWKLDPNIQMTK